MLKKLIVSLSIVAALLGITPTPAHAAPPYQACINTFTVRSAGQVQIARGTNDSLQRAAREFLAFNPTREEVMNAAAALSVETDRIATQSRRKIGRARTETIACLRSFGAPPAAIDFVRERYRNAVRQVNGDARYTKNHIRLRFDAYLATHTTGAVVGPAITDGPADDDESEG